MDFRFSDQQLEYQTLARELTEKHFVPRAAKIDDTGEYPWDNVKVLVDSGLAGLNLPKEYGGQGADLATVCTVLEEVSRGCASTCAILNAYCLGSYPIVLAGTDEQKERYLRSAVEEGRAISFAMSEKCAGSDAAALQTTAVREGDEYVLNGEKFWIGNGGASETYVVMAKTDPPQKARGISAFIVEKGTPGFSITRYERKMGIRGTMTSNAILDGVRIPVSNLLGEEGKGFLLAMQTLDIARPTVAAQAIGIAQAAYELAARWAMKREQFDEPIIKKQAIAFKLADMSMEINAARMLMYQTAVAYDQGAKRITRSAAMSKLYASEVANRVVNSAVQIHGGYGYIKEYAVERLYRDQKITEIYEGTSEIQRLVLSTYVEQDFIEEDGKDLQKKRVKNDVL